MRPPAWQHTYPAVAGLLLAAVLALLVPPSALAAIPPQDLPSPSGGGGTAETFDGAAPLTGEDVFQGQAEEAGREFGPAPGGGITGAVGCTGQAVVAVGAAITTVTTGLPTSDIGTKAGALATAGGTLLNCVGTFFNLVKNTVTASGITYLAAKSKLDVIATAVIKTAIKTSRDMVLRWIITGRFEGPVFVASFSADAAQIAENASRIFLSSLTRINFCSFIGPPSPRTFVLSADFGLSCTLPSAIEKNYTATIITLATNPGAVSLADRLGLQDPQNNTIYNSVRLIDERDAAVARALIARNAEYLTGQGFLCLRDEKTGQCSTPGSFVARQVMASLIEGPIEEASVANTVQQAIAEIIDTAIRVNIERGLNKAFRPST